MKRWTQLMFVLLALPLCMPAHARERPRSHHAHDRHAHSPRHHVKHRTHRPCFVHPTYQRRESLIGSAEMTAMQVSWVQEAGLPVIHNDGELADAKAAGEIVNLEESESLVLDVTNPAYAALRPFARDYLEDLADAFYKEFGIPLRVTSAFRTLDYQIRLTKRNTNALKGTEETPERMSTHPFATTVDISKKYMTADQIEWMLDQLETDSTDDLVQGTDELSCASYVFHIMVRPPKAAPVAPTPVVATPITSATVPVIQN